MSLVLSSLEGPAGVGNREGAGVGTATSWHSLSLAPGCAHYRDCISPSASTFSLSFLTPPSWCMVLSLPGAQCHSCSGEESMGLDL